MKNFKQKAIALMIIFSGIGINTNLSKGDSLIMTSVVIEEPVTEELDSWDLFTEAVIWKESRGDESAVGDNGRAVGVLQLHPIMVDEANRILKLRSIDKKYTYEDRLSREKSIEMFNIVQSFWNKDKDFQVALDVWNIGHPDSYRNDIMKKYDELRSQS